MKKLLKNIGCILIAVPAFLVIIAVWGVTNFIGEEENTPARPASEIQGIPADEARSNWQPASMPSASSAG